MIRKLATLFLLGLFLFNLIGYRLLTGYLEEKADVELQAQLYDNNYNESDLITIKVATPIPPYTNSSPGFESMKGSVTIDGVNYQYVKRRFHNDTLELKCIPNHEHTGILNARDEFFKLANDFVNLPSKKLPGGTSSKSPSFKNAMSDYEQQQLFQLKDIIAASVKYCSNQPDSGLLNAFILTPEQPPEAVV